MTRQEASHGGAQGLQEIDVLWLSAGLSCDGESVALTAAMQPSLEDLVFGSIPWIPKIRLYNPFLSYQNGDELLQVFHEASEGKRSPFILVVEGSIPDETNKVEGYWAAFGSDRSTG